MAQVSLTTHLGIGAHADDLEIMAFHGIAQCYRSKTKWFTGVTCTDGVGPMKALRREEQLRAARMGKYLAMFQLGYPSAAIQRRLSRLETDLEEILLKTRPEIVYTHNPADRHTTHVSVAIHTLLALRRLPRRLRPRRVLGCEVWGSLDWLPDDRKVALDVSGYDPLAKNLLLSFPSQIKAGKRYDLATLGRRRANATYHQPRMVDASTATIFAMDLTPLVSSSRDIFTYVDQALGRFRHEVRDRIRDLKR